MATLLMTKNDNIFINNLMPQNIFINDDNSKLSMKYICILSSSEKNIIQSLIDELEKIEMNDKLSKKINEYSQNMKYLLRIYNNGKSNKVFQNDNFSLYADIQHQLSIIIDIKYDIIEKVIKTVNEKQVLNKLNLIITEHKNMIEDINKSILPNMNIMG